MAHPKSSTNMPSKKPNISLREAISLLSTEDNPGNYSITISPEWTTQIAVLGGFLSSVILAATRKYIDAKFGEGRYPDPISVFVQFLRPIPAGKVFVVCQILQSSSRQCVIKVELSTTKPSSTESSDSPSAEGGRCSTVAIIMQGDLSKENGVSQETKPIIAADLPNRETQCTQITDPIVEATPVTSKLRWIAPRSPDGLWGHRLGGHIREVWLSFKDGSKVDTLALGLLSDTPLQPPATHTSDFYRKYALSTLCLSVEFKKRVEGLDWIFIRSYSNKVNNGRYDVNLQIMDEGGEILALSHHVVYIVELQQRQRGRSMSQGGKL